MISKLRKTIIFVNPPLAVRERYGDLASGGAVEPPHGLTYLASITRKRFFISRILDAEALKLNINETVKEILNYSPKYVGITATTASIYSAGNIAEAIKKIDYKIKVIVGGVHLTSLPEETMEAFGSFDIGVVGEGELTICELLEAIEEGRDLDNVKGLIIRRNGQLKFTGEREFIKNLDDLPLPAWDLLPSLSNYYSVPPQSVYKIPSTSLVTSRGCPGRCIFCDRSVFGNICRAHSAEYIMKMIQTLYERYQIREILFEDDNFLLFRSRLIKLTQLLRSSDIDISWSCLARPDTVEEDTLLMAKKAGCWQILYGIESGSQKILDFINKEINLRQIEEALIATKKLGLKTKGFLMVGHPLETRQTIQESLDFIKRVPLDDISVTFFTPFPGSQVYTIASRYGRIQNDWKKMTTFHPAFIPQGFTKKDLYNSSKYLLRGFYFRPKIFLSYFKRISSLRQSIKLLKGGYALLKYILKPK